MGSEMSDLGMSGSGGAIVFGSEERFQLLGRLEFWEGSTLTDCYFARKGLTSSGVVVSDFCSFISVLRFLG